MKSSPYEPYQKRSDALAKKSDQYLKKQIEKINKDRRDCHKKLSDISIQEYLVRLEMNKRGLEQ